MKRTWLLFISILILLSSLASVSPLQVIGGSCESTIITMDCIDGGEPDQRTDGCLSGEYETSYCFDEMSGEDLSFCCPSPAEPRFAR